VSTEDPRIARLLDSPAGWALDSYKIIVSDMLDGPTMLLLRPSTIVVSLEVWLAIKNREALAAERERRAAQRELWALRLRYGLLWGTVVAIVAAECWWLGTR
jgi:hypothetical protein